MVEVEVEVEVEVVAEQVDEIRVTKTCGENSVLIRIVGLIVMYETNVYVGHASFVVQFQHKLNTVPRSFNFNVHFAHVVCHL